MKGIVSYGISLPSFRITTEEIAKAHNKNPKLFEKGLGVTEKAVSDKDEDAATLAIEAGRRTLDASNTDSQKISAVYVGSESHPYSVKPTSTIVGDMLKVSPYYFSADLQFACKAGTAAMQIIHAFLKSESINYGLAIGSDTAQGAPGDVLEYTAACGAAAFLLGNNKEEVIAEIVDTVSFSSDTPDFWRGVSEKFPSHGGRFTGEPGYFKHIEKSTKAILEKTKLSIDDFDHVIFHMPNGVFPKRMAKKLHVSDEQLSQGYIVPKIGNTYSASSLIGLANVLDNAKAGEKILLSSYGSGAGSDSFVLQVTENITKFQSSKKVKELIEEKTYINYQEYLKMRGKI